LYVWGAWGSAHWMEESADAFGPGLYAADSETVMIKVEDIVGLEYGTLPVRAKAVKLLPFTSEHSEDWEELTTDEHNGILATMSGRVVRTLVDPPRKDGRPQRKRTAKNR
jgi:hypothetical protein